MSRVLVATSLVALGLAAAAFVVHLMTGDVFCGDDPGGCPEDGSYWDLMRPVARVAVVVSLALSVAVAAVAWHPVQGAWRLALMVTAAGLTAWSASAILDAHALLPSDETSACDDDPNSSAKCGPTASWDVLYWIVPLTTFVGIMLLARQGIKSFRASPPQP